MHSVHSLRNPHGSNLVCHSVRQNDAVDGAVEPMNDLSICIFAGADGASEQGIAKLRCLPRGSADNGVVVEHARIVLSPKRSGRSVIVERICQTYGPPSATGECARCGARNEVKLLDRFFNAVTSFWKHMDRAIEDATDRGNGNERRFGNVVDRGRPTSRQCSSPVVSAYM